MEKKKKIKYLGCWDAGIPLTFNSGDLCSKLHHNPTLVLKRTRNIITAS